MKQWGTAHSFSLSSTYGRTDRHSVRARSPHHLVWGWKEGRGGSLPNPLRSTSLSGGGQRTYRGVQHYELQPGVKQKKSRLGEMAPPSTLIRPDYPPPQKPHQLGSRVNHFTSCPHLRLTALIDPGSHRCVHEAIRPRGNLTYVG